MDAALDIAELELKLPPWTRELLACLTQRRREAFVLREVTGMTFDEIGAQLGISHSRACQLHDAAVRLITDAARRAALLAQHAPVVVPHRPPVHAEQRCVVPPEVRSTLGLPIEALALGIRGANCLENGGIRTVGDLIRKSEGEVLKIMNLGRKTLREIKDALAGIGLHLDMDPGHDPSSEPPGT